MGIRPTTGGLRVMYRKASQHNSLMVAPACNNLCVIVAAASLLPEQRFTAGQYVMGAKSLRKVQMPNRYGFIPAKPERQ